MLKPVYFLFLSSLFFSHAFSEPKSLLFTNDCIHPVKVMVLYQGLDNSWKMEGWWPFDYKASATLTTGQGVDLKSINSIFYYYAESSDGSGLFWGGNESRNFQGKKLSLAQHQDDTDLKYLNFSVACADDTPAEPVAQANTPPAPIAAPTLPHLIEQKDSLKVGSGFIKIKATFNQNGLLEISDQTVAKTKNDVKGQYIIIGRDKARNTIFFSREFKSSIACPPDSKTKNCPQEGKGTGWESFHAGFVGQVNTLEIYFRQGKLKDYASMVKKEVRRQCAVNQSLPEQLRAAIFAKYGFRSCKPEARRRN